MRLEYMILITNCKGLLYIGIINCIELVSSSARGTSAKFQKGLVRSDIERPGPIDRTPEAPGSGKKQTIIQRRVKWVRFCNVIRTAIQQWHWGRKLQIWDCGVGLVLLLAAWSLNRTKLLSLCHCKVKAVLQEFYHFSLWWRSSYIRKSLRGVM